MAAITGDTAGMHSLSRTWGSAAGAAGVQGARFAGAYSVLPVSSFSGGAADRMRSFVSEMRAGAAALAKAYDRVASYLPRVANAIEEAKRAEAARQRAQDALTAAKQQLTAAEQAESNALKAVMTATLLSPTPALGAVGTCGAPVPAPGPTPAQLAALTKAEHERVKAQHEVDRANHAFQLAEQHFQEAERHRQSVLRSFTALCQTESAIAMRALPQAPTPPTGFAGLMGLTLPITPLATLLLTPEAKALADVPTLAAWNFTTTTVPRLMAALRHQQFQLIEAWQPHFAPLVVPKVHKDGGDFLSGALGMFNDATGFVGGKLNAAAGFVGGKINDMVDIGGRVAEGAFGATKGTVEGLWDFGKLVVESQPGVYGFVPPSAERARAQLRAIFEAPVVHPVRFAEQAIDLRGFQEDPAKWFGGAGITAAVTVGTEGVGSGAKALADSARAAQQTARDLHTITPLAQAVDPRLGAFTRTQAARLDEHARQLDARSNRLDAAHSGLDGYDKTSTGVGVVGSAQKALDPCGPGDGGVGRDYLTGKVTSHFVK